MARMTVIPCTPALVEIRYALVLIVYSFLVPFLYHFLSEKLHSP